MTQKKPSIGIYTGSDLHWVLGKFNEMVIMWFWNCLYDEKEIADRFENSALILKRRAIEMKFLDVVCNATGYSREYFIAQMKTTLPKLFKTLPTLAAFKVNVENGKFTGIDHGDLLWAINDFLAFVYPWRWAVDFTDIDYKAGCPDFANDYTAKIINGNVNPTNGDPFNYSTVTPETPVVTPVVTPEISQSSVVSMGIPIVIGVGVLIALFSNKSKK